MKRSIVIIMIVILLTNLCGSNLAMMAKAEELSLNSDAEVKLYSKATLQDDFSDNRVLVVMKNSASLEFNEYQVSDFPEIDCAAIKTISNGAEQKAKQQYDVLLDAVSTRSIIPDSVDTDYLSVYNQIICIELQQTGKKNVLNAIKELEKREDVLYVGPDYIMSIDSVSSTAYNDQYFNDQWAIEDIQLTEALEVTTGNHNVVVGVIDTGIQASHPDLTGKVDVTRSADFSSGTTVMGVAMDPVGHGTHIAGIIAANRNNAIGIAGICDNVTLISLKVALSDESIPAVAVISAIDYAEELDIPIINLSLGKHTSNEDSILYKEALQNYTGLAICSAGNQGNNDDGGYIAHYPSSFDFDHVLSVGASTELGTKASYSNYGSISVDIFAPGEDILSCYTPALCVKGTHNTVNTVHKSNGYHYISGTSQAAPFVTGVAALILSENPNLAPTEIKSIIMLSCTKEASLTNYCVSGGRLNAYNAVLNANMYRTLSLNSAITNTIVNEDNQWYKFTAGQAGWHSFYTSGNADMVGELFAELVSDDSTTGQLVYSDSVSDLTLNISANNFSFRYYLTKGQTVYLRVSTDDVSGTYQICVIRS